MICKIYQQKKLFLIYLLKILFWNTVLSYFAKPNYIVYDEWFDNDFKKITKNKIKFNIKKKIIDSFSIFEFETILGILLFFVSRFKKIIET